jgi:hypothetical protein
LNQTLSMLSFCLSQTLSLGRSSSLIGRVLHGKLLL